MTAQSALLFTARPATPTSTCIPGPTIQWHRVYSGCQNSNDQSRQLVFLWCGANREREACHGYVERQCASITSTLSPAKEERNWKAREQRQPSHYSTSVASLNQQVHPESPEGQGSVRTSTDSPPRDWYT